MFRGFYILPYPLQYVSVGNVKDVPAYFLMQTEVVPLPSTADAGTQRPCLGTIYHKLLWGQCGSVGLVAVVVIRMVLV